MWTLQKWKDSWESMPRTWWIHTQTPLLYENRRISPYSLSKECNKITFKMKEMGFYTCCKICTSCLTGNMSLWRHTFLCQWVSATSSSTCLKPPLPARQNICRHGDILAERNWFYLDISRYGDRMWPGRQFSCFCSFLCFCHLFKSWSLLFCTKWVK